MAREFLLVDGYNIIHAWDELRELMNTVSLESARLRLMDILSNYKGIHSMTIILVFDAYLVKGNPGSVEKYHNIYVVYTKEAELADQYIERVVSQMPRHYDVKVATSDGLEQVIISGHGAVRMSARELKMAVEQTEHTIRQQYLQKKSPKNNLLADNLDEEARNWLEQMRYMK